VTERRPSTLIGSEDVLDAAQVAEPDEPYDPSERTNFRTGVDIAVAVLIVVVALVVGVIVWQNSEIRTTSSQVNPNPVADQQQPAEFPASLGEAWHAPSSATQVPVALGGVVVTGEGGEVAGRDPITGEVLWRYSRDLPLCTVSSAWSLAVAVFRTDGRELPAGDSRAGGGCSQIAAFDPPSGRLGKQRQPGEKPDKPSGGQRHTDAELGTRLVGDGTYVTTTGRKLLTTLRSDLVQTMEYGQLPSLVNPNKQPRTGCTYGSVAAAPGRVGVVERCPEDSGDRLTVYRATNSDNKSDEPAVVFSVVVGTTGARVVALTDRFAAVALPDASGGGRLAVYDETGKAVAEYPVELGPQDLRGDPDGLVVPVTKGTAAVYWFTGSRTIALDSQDLRPLWSALSTIGPGVIFAERVVIPVRDGLRVVDQSTGTLFGTLPVDRQGYAGTVSMATTGPILLEQRGGNLVALR
jgi:hypothetical protein